MVVPAELRRLAVRAYLQRLSLDDKPILVGPWRSEVGFEALYWVPFLRWCAKHVHRFTARSVVVTRGGAETLYGSPVNIEGQQAHAYGRAVDLYTLRSVTDVRRENLYDWTKTKLQKQIRCTDWDKQVLKEAAERALGKDARYHILHPSWMYWALEPFWNEDRGLKYLLPMTDYTPLPKPSVEAGLELPERYIAMKFYGRHTFPWPHPDVAAFVSHLAGTIASQVPVVLLNNTHAGDEHGDIPIAGPNIHTLPAVPSEQNLALQAAVIGKAIGFVGTYGGLSQLALRMGVPSASFYTEWGGTAHAHLSLSSYLSKRMGVEFLVGSLRDAHLWKQVLAAPAPQPVAA